MFVIVIYIHPCLLYVTKDGGWSLPKFCQVRPEPTSGLYYKCLTIVIYYPNESGQYYKTTITIIIDDPSLS